MLLVLSHERLLEVRAEFCLADVPLTLQDAGHVLDSRQVCRDCDGLRAAAGFALAASGLAKLEPHDARPSVRRSGTRLTSA